MDIKQYIKSKRETLSDSSVKTYASILNSLYKKVFGAEEMDFEKFSDVNAITEFLKDMPANKRKTILSALVVITGEPKYKDLMADDVAEYNKEIGKQEMTEAQEEAWIEPADIDNKLTEWQKIATQLYKKGNLSVADLQEIQNYIIVVLLSGKFIPTRRAKDFTDFKIRNITENSNYIDKNEMIFNSYKTAFAYGQQKQKIPIKLKNILKKWIEVNPTDYLLFDVNMNPLSSVKLNQRLNKIFGKGKGINAIRHSVLTEKFGDTIQQKKDIAETMTAMGSSPAMLTTYVKEKPNITVDVVEKKKRGRKPKTPAEQWVKELNEKWDEANKKSLN